MATRPTSQPSAIERNRTTPYGNAPLQRGAFPKSTAPRPAGHPPARAPAQLRAGDEAFRLAAVAAIRDAVRRARPLLLEPVMSVEVLAPGEEQGDLLGDLTRRRANIVAVESGASHVVLKAQVPLGELWGYANAIRSLSRGRASYSMTPSHFEQVPDTMALKLASDLGASSGK